MNYSIPEDWVPCSESSFQDVLNATNYVRDGWGGCIIYLEHHNRKPFGAIRDSDQQHFLSPMIVNQVMRRRYPDIPQMVDPEVRALSEVWP